MNKIYLLLLLLASILSCNFPKQNVWNKNYEQKIYDELYNSQTVQGLVKDKSQRKLLVLYLVKRYKVALPFGFYSISDDSLKNLSAKFVEEYTVDFNATVAWDENFESAYKNNINRDYLSRYGKLVQNTICDCVIAKLQEIYPDSVNVPIPDTLTIKEIKACKKENALL